MKTIEEGDVVFDKDGNLTTVEHVSEVHNNPCFKITFDNNDTIICDQEHKWPISFRRAKGLYQDKILTTEELYEIIISKPRTAYNIPKIKCVNSLNIEHVPLPIDPYVLGA